MGQGTPILNLSQYWLEPAAHPDIWAVMPYPVQPSSTLKAGQVMAYVNGTDTTGVQTLSETGTITAGTFQLAIQGYLNPTGALNYNDSASTIQTAINAVIGAGLLTAGGGALPGTPVTFTGAGNWLYGPLPAISVVNASLTGGTLAVAQTTPGVKNGVIAAYNSALIANPSAAPTLTDGATGTWPAGVYSGSYTYVNANGESLPSPVGAYLSAGTKKIHFAALSGIPAGVTKVNFYVNGQFAIQKTVSSNAVSAFDVDLADVTGAAVAPPKTSSIYSATDGSATPIGFLQTDVYTDSSGNITYGTSAGVQTGGQGLTANVVVKGYLRTEQLVGLDANAVSKLGRLLTGPLAGPGILNLY